MLQYHADPILKSCSTVAASHVRAPHFRTVVFSARGGKLSLGLLILKRRWQAKRSEGDMELVVVIVVLVVAGAMIPGNPEILFFR